MKDILTIIIPIHKFNEDVKAYLGNAVKSINFGATVMFVGPKTVMETVEKLDLIQAEYVVNENTDFAEQVDAAVMNCVTRYFTVLEFDDVFLPTWSKVMNSELENGHQSILIPFNEYTDVNSTFKSFGNEIAWDAAFLSEDGKLGYITKDELKTYKDFNVTGAIFKTEDFISMKGLKSEFKYFAWYEYLVRASVNDKEIYVVPRVCYRHMLQRPDSYFTQFTFETDTEKKEYSDLLLKIKEEFRSEENTAQ